MDYTVHGILQARIPEWVDFPFQGIFPTQGLNPDLLHCRWIIYQLSHKGSPRILEWGPVPSPGYLPDSGIKQGSSALQEDSLPAEPQGKPKNTAVIPYPFSSRSSWARNRTMVSCIAGRFFTNWAIREALHTEGSRFKLKGKSVKSTNLLSETLGDRHVLEFKNMWGNIK